LPALTGTSCWLSPMAMDDPRERFGRRRGSLIARRVVLAALLAGAAAAAPASGQQDVLARAERLVEEGRYAEAKPLLTDLTRRESGNARAAYLAGRVHAQFGEADAAVRELERAVRHDARSAEYHLWLGRAYGLQLAGANVIRQRSIAARLRQSIERAMELDPARSDARLQLIEFHLRAPQLAGGDMQQALHHARELAARDPYVGSVVLARVQDAMNDSAAATRTLAAVVAAYPDSVPPRIMLATRHIDAGRFEAGHAVLRPLIERPQPVAAALYVLGRAGAVTGRNLDVAERALRDYLRLTPGPGEQPHAAAHTRLGDILYHRGDVAGARREYEAALRLDPGFQPALDGLRRNR
jgi:tetratricopeptide (TPR) repeat protein